MVGVSGREPVGEPVLFAVELSSLDERRFLRVRFRDTPAERNWRICDPVGCLPMWASVVLGTLPDRAPCGVVSRRRCRRRASLDTSDCRVGENIGDRVESLSCADLWRMPSRTSCSRREHVGLGTTRNAVCRFQCCLVVSRLVLWCHYSGLRSSGSSGRYLWVQRLGVDCRYEVFPQFGFDLWVRRLEVASRSAASAPGPDT